MAVADRSHSPSDDASIWSPPLPQAPGFEHTVVKTPGLSTHLASIGQGDPVVLLHGFPQHWWQWRNVAPTIAAAGYRVLCPDLRGAGWTIADDPHIDRQSRLHDLVALFDALEIDRVHLALTTVYLAPSRGGTVERTRRNHVAPSRTDFRGRSFTYVRSPRRCDQCGFCSVGHGPSF